MSADHIRGAGAVVWRYMKEGGTPEPGGNIEVLLVHRSKPKDAEKNAARDLKTDWSLPKGRTKKKGKWPGYDHPVYTAFSEVLQETGIEAELGPRLGAVEYPIHASPKTILYWSASQARDHGFKAEGNEVDLVRWLPLPTARRAVAYVGDQEILDVLVTEARPTKPVIFLRSAQAAGSGADDRDRPLDRLGAEQAKAISRLLGCFGTLPVISSRARRCQETVWPYMKKRGLKAEVRDDLYHKEFDVTAAAFQMCRYIENESGVIVCGHHKELPQLAMKIFGRRAGVFDDPLGRVPELSPGEFMVFHSTTSRRFYDRYRVAYQGDQRQGDQRQGG